MKILHVHKYFHAKDGAGRYLFDLMRLQEGAGHTVAGFAMEDPRNAPNAWSKYYVSNLDTTGVGGIRSSLKQIGRAWWSLEAKDKMEDMLEAFRPDIVHIHNIYTHLSPSVLVPCKKRGIPVVMTVHDYALLSADYTLSGDQRFIKGSRLATLVLNFITQAQRVLKLYDRGIARYFPVSAFVKGKLVHGGYPEEKMAVIQPAVSPALYGRTFDHVREDAVLFVGRLEAYKGVGVYLEAAALRPDLTFYVVGTGPLASTVQAFSQNHTNVSYLGYLEPEEVYKKMASVKAGIFPSVWQEPFGMVALESLAVGTPIIVSDIGGLGELAVKSGGGKAFTPGNADALVGAIDAMLSDPDYEKMAEQGIAYANKEHSPEAFLRKIMVEYGRAEDFIR
ncbi:MAG: glycosyltransferase [Patescibacteria group bacterium]|jgi:glycosyltransferase involved in cell wall biosynthesis